jgi:glycerol-3-phosphate dehydrogenase
MRHLQTEILVIGGGATGTGVLRDLAMRGFKSALVERRDLAYGTTGRFHGLLHSGARYVVKDSPAARECYEENQILKRIMPQCIEDTGGFFVLTPHDDPAYVTQFVEGCYTAGIPLEALSVSQMLKQEPLLNPLIQQCFRVPDASADSFLATALNAESARQYGAQVLTYHEVRRLLVDHNTLTGPRMVCGAICQDLIKDEEVQIDASLVINASGSWAGKIAKTAGIVLNMVPGKGTMLALNHRVVNTVVNRCKMPSDGDILVPTHTVSIIGTTDIRVPDPDHYAIEPWEIRLMMDEGEKLIPQFKQFRILRAWAGVRPLVEKTDSEDNRDISREFVLLDHAQRDGVERILTITSGKWTTFRKMAQVTVDKACEKLKVDRRCRTHLEGLPSQTTHSHHHYPGVRLEKIEQEHLYGHLVCECELATEQDIQEAIINGGAATLDDIRRATRLGMGPCQGGYCTYRVTGMLQNLRHLPIEQSNVSLRDFLQERWKGALPVLNGQQLRQARFNELIYVNLLNAASLPGERASNLAAHEYIHGGEEGSGSEPEPAHTSKPAALTKNQPIDLLVIGGGLAGLFAAYLASKKRIKTSLITQGWGALNWGSGCIDIFGYVPPDYVQQVESPLQYLERLLSHFPDHPYSLAGLDALENAIRLFMEFCEEAGYPFHGTLETNIELPTALGTRRPACLVPETMIAGETSGHMPMLIVGFEGYLDFYPNLVAENLSAQGIRARETSLALKSLEGRKIITSRVLANLFESQEFRQEVIDVLKPKLGSAGRIGFPAVLGIKNAQQIKKHLESELGLPVFEIPGLPPSIPGVRLQNLLTASIEKLGGIVYNGMQVTAAVCEEKSITGIYSSAAARQITHTSKNYIMASGGILGGGFVVNSNGYTQELIFNLPVTRPEPANRWLHSRFMDGPGHPIFSAGLEVNNAFQPINQGKEIIYKNLSIIGSALAHSDPVRERSIEGIALASAFSAVEKLVGNGSA